MSTHIVSNGYAGNSEIKDEDLEAATFLNNHVFVSEWLKRFTREEKDKEIRRKRCGSLLRRASYCHSVDVVKCILPPPANCEGQGEAPRHCQNISSCACTINSSYAILLWHRACSYNILLCCK